MRKIRFFTILSVSLQPKDDKMKPKITTNSKKRTFLKVLAVLAVTLLLAGGAVGYAVWQMTVPSALTRDIWLYVRPGDTRDSILAQLRDKGVDSRRVFWIERCMDYYQLDDILSSSDRSGAYLLSIDLPALRVASRIARHQQTAVRIAFNNVRLASQLASRITEPLLIDSAAMMTALRDTALLRSLDVDTATVLTLFLPDTYQVWWNISAEDLIRRMYREHEAFWTPQRKTQAQAMGLTPMQCSIIASIAEEETHNAGEIGIVARLYANRFRIGMPLQADPTVKYAVGDFSLRRILAEHLQTPSPYNTYLHAGLPPGPIRIPEKATLDALLQSKEHPYLYMCAKADFSGTHNFARTLQEHQRNAALYHRALNKLKIKP